MPDSIDLNGFSDLLPSELTEFIELINEWGFELTLVGGAVRDFFLHGILSNDLDFEIRSINKIDDEKWESTLRDLFKKIENREDTQVEKLRFNIFRVKLSSIELEISSPRIEIYENNKNDYGHSDFKVEFSSNYSHEQSFARRDFSLNAMGIVCRANGALDFVDPFNGIKSISIKELDYLTDDFFKDPVRFLRTLRFKVAHNLSLSRRLKDNIIYFNLDKLSLHYFVQEGKKIGLERLANEMDFCRRKFSTKLPLWASEFHKFKIEGFSRCNSLLDVLLNYSIQKNISDEDLLLLGDCFKIKLTIVKKVIMLKSFKDFNLKDYKEEMQKINFEDLVLEETFIKVCRLFKSIDKVEESLLKFFFNQKDILILKDTIVKDDLFEKLIPTTKREHISMLGIYCHIIKKD